MAALLLAAACFGFTVFVFYPGILTYDARYMIADIHGGSLGDWQSPVMTVLWGLIDPAGPGTGSLLLVTAGLYWLGFGALACALARRSAWWGVLALAAGLLPPGFIFIGVTWRDIPFAALWLLAGTLVFALQRRGGLPMALGQMAALALVALGVLLRPNALPAAPLLLAYVLWPRRFLWKRSALLFVPAAAGLLGLVQLVYYDALGATRQYPAHSIMVFDLGGISHFAHRNLFPGTWTPDQSAQIAGGCYEPTVWDIYWTLPPCSFVMHALEGQALFASPVLTAAWRQGILAQPLAYLRHRAAFFRTFLLDDNFTLYTMDLDDQTKTAFAGNPRLMAVKAVNDALKPTPALRAGTWLVFDLLLCVFGWWRRAGPAGAFILGVCGSGAVYALSYAVLGVATDFRYVYWSVLAGLAGAVAAAWQVRWPAEGDA